MPDLRLIAPPPRTQLLEAIRGRLGHAVPGSRILAEQLLGADAHIDFVALEPSGRVVLILVGEHDEDLELVGRGLAQRSWVAARLADWVQLAPDLDLRPGADVRVVLVCPGYAQETRTAIDALGSGVMTGVAYRCVQNGAELEVLLEHLAAPEAPAAAAPPVQPLREPGAPGSFRTGLSDADLGLTPEERREFD